MDTTFKNVLAVIAGVVIGGIVNGGLINLTDGLIPVPEGVDVNDVNSIRENIHLYSPKHFLLPFLAHALGTLVGAFVAAKIAAKNKLNYALVIGFFFLLGGITMVYMVGGPAWFIALDLIVAYVPMAWLGAKIAGTN